MSRISVPGTNKIVSHYDATFAVDDPYPDQVAARGPDPLLDGLVRAYGGAYAAYARDELGFKTEMTYILLASDISGKWDWEGGSGRAGANVVDDLRALLVADAVVPPADRARLQRHGHALRGQPLRARPSAADGRSRCARSCGSIAAATCSISMPGSRHAFSTDAKAFYQEAP